MHASRKRSYGYRLDHKMDNLLSLKTYESRVQLMNVAKSMEVCPKDMHKQIVGFIFMQMTAYARIAEQGQQAVNALFKELSQLDCKHAFNPLKSTQGK